MSKTKKSPGQGVGGGRPALVPGKVRVGVTISMSTGQRDKLEKISGGKPSEFVRNVIDTYPAK